MTLLWTIVHTITPSSHSSVSTWSCDCWRRNRNGNSAGRTTGWRNSRGISIPVGWTRQRSHQSIVLIVTIIRTITALWWWLWSCLVPHIPSRSTWRRNWHGISSTVHQLPRHQATASRRHVAVLHGTRLTRQHVAVPVTIRSIVAHRIRRRWWRSSRWNMRRNRHTR